MDFILGSQASLFLRIFFAGAVIAFFYDNIRFFRKIVTHKSYVRQIEDLIFWICAVYFVFSFYIRENFGEIRVFSVFALCLGMILYFFAISPHYMRACDIPAKYIRLAYFKTARLIGKIFAKFKKMSAKQKNVLHFKRKCAKIKLKRK